MDQVNLSTLASVAVVVSTVAGAYLKVRKITKDHQKDRKVEAAAILQRAKEEDAKVKADMEAKIESLNTKLNSIHLSVEKDIAYIKESHSNELNALSEKIETLRDELRNQHNNLVTLVTKLIDHS